MTTERGQVEPPMCGHSAHFVIIDVFGVNNMSVGVNIYTAGSKWYLGCVSRLIGHVWWAGELLEKRNQNHHTPLYKTPQKTSLRHLNQSSSLFHH